MWRARMLFTVLQNAAVVAPHLVDQPLYKESLCRDGRVMVVNRRA
jgi:hypothetical protein